MQAVKGNNQEMVEDLVRNGEILTRRDDVGQVSGVPVFYWRFKARLAHEQPQGSLIDRWICSILNWINTSHKKFY